MTSQVEIPQEVRRIFGLRSKKILADHARSDTDLRSELEEGLIWAFRVGLQARRNKPVATPQGPAVFSSRRSNQPTAANTDRSTTATGPAVFKHAASVTKPVLRGPDPRILQALNAFGFEAYGEHGERDDSDHVFWRPIPVAGSDGYTWVVSRRVGPTLYEHSEIQGADLKPCIEQNIFCRASLAGAEGVLIEDEIYIASEGTRAAYLTSLGAEAAA